MRTMKPITLAVVGVLLVAGCQTFIAFQKNERAQLQAAQITFTTLVNELTALRATGKFDVETADKITLAIKAGNAVLDRWAATLKAGGTLVGSPANILSEFDAVVATLAEAKKGAK